MAGTLDPPKAVEAALARYFLAGSGIHQRRDDAAELPRAKKPMPAGVTAIGRKSEPALQRDHRPGLDAFTRNMLQVEVPAPRAVSVALENGGDTPTVESAITSVASPRSQADRARNEIEYPATVRPKAIRTATLRTNHCHPTL